MAIPRAGDNSGIRPAATGFRDSDSGVHRPRNGDRANIFRAFSLLEVGLGDQILVHEKLSLFE
jgi:hypothetical protein